MPDEGIKIRFGNSKAASSLESTEAEKVGIFVYLTCRYATMESKWRKFPSVEFDDVQQIESRWKVVSSINSNDINKWNPSEQQFIQVDGMQQLARHLL